MKLYQLRFIAGNRSHSNRSHSRYLEQKGIKCVELSVYRSLCMGWKNRSMTFPILGFKVTALHLQSTCWETVSAPTAASHTGSWWPGYKEWGLPEPLPVIRTTRGMASAFFLLSKSARTSHSYNLHYFQNLAAREFKGLLAPEQVGRSRDTCRIEEIGDVCHSGG